MMKTPTGIVGDGLIATHFAHYLKLEHIPFIQWSRKRDRLSPEEKLFKCKIVLILISDDSIENFIKQHPQLNSKTLIHFSGVLASKKAISFHPLMTFSNEIYTLEKYRSIPFVGTSGSKDFSYYFPRLKNSTYFIPEKQKPLYHALCVLSGNLTTLLWLKATNDFESELHLPKEILFPYLEQITQNIKKNPTTALTGPIRRQDIQTMKSNKKALQSSLWSKIYSLFNRVYKEELQ